MTQCRHCGADTSNPRFCSQGCYRSATRKPLPPRGEFSELYASGASARQLAAKYDVSQSTIYSWIDAFGIPRRSISEAVSRARTGATYSEAHRAAIAEGQRTRYADRPHFRYCELCGNHFDLLFPSSPKKYCGRHCAATARARKWGGGNRRSRQGKREALGGLFVRSSWEANTALVLNEWIKEGRIVRWEYESQLFEFVGIKKGNRYYLPDFKVFFPDGSHVFYEVKGWLDPASKTKLARFAKYYPDERLVLVDKAAYKELTAEYKHLAGWES